MRNFLKFRVIPATILVAFLFPGTVWAALQVKNFRYWVSPNKTRLVLDLSSYPKFIQYKANQNKTLVVEISGGKNKIGTSSLLVRHSSIKKIRLQQKKNGVLGLVVDLDSALTTKVFALKKYLHKSDRLVIDIYAKDSKKKWQKKVKKIQKIKQQGKKIVVLDPGHGGEDPGALGRYYKYREKNVALYIARKCQKLLQQVGWILPVLTRTGDYYVSLGRRVRIARDYNADLFVSIHTNANRNRRAKGSSVYYLSHKGATDKASRLLAMRENAADLMGGVTMSRDKTLNAILISMSQTSTINDSLLFGDALVKNFAQSINRVKMDRKLRSAPFAVLKTPHIPSILFETAYISNKKEEKLLGSSSFQQDIAETLARAILKYLGNETPATEFKTARVSKPVKNKSKPAGSRVHVVKRGDTVYNISVRYGVTMTRLKKTNRIGRSNRILVGQKLKIPPPA